MFHNAIQQSSSKSKGRVLVIGAGVIGLTTALELVQNGYRVTVLAKDFVAPDNKSKLTTQAAAAVWSIPVPICKWRDRSMDRRVRSWAMDSYEKFCKLATNSEETGIFMSTRINAYYHNINDVQSYKIYMEDHKDLPGFRHSKHILKERAKTSPSYEYRGALFISGVYFDTAAWFMGGIPEESGLVDATAFESPLTDTDIYLMWLTKKCMSNGIDFVRETVHGPLRTQCDSLMKKYKADRIVNCTGINARELAEDNDVYPMAGIGLAVHNADTGVKPIDFSFMVLGGPVWRDEETNTIGSIVIAPRANYGLWIGTIKQETYNTDFDVHGPIARRVLSECQKVYPPLKTIQEDKLQIISGIRPMRKGGPRVEQDPICPHLVHNYGHCSFGICLSWGSARDVVNILEKSSMGNSSRL